VAARIRQEDREILRLAGPAFLALVAEPLFLLADSAIVGHLGTRQLAGLGIAGAVLSTLISVCIFLAYGTTASVARRIGAGDLRAALTQGLHGIWLAIVIGVATTALGIPLTPVLVGLFGPGSGVAHEAETYLRIGLVGAVPLLVALATTGILRGLQDTRTPLVVAVAGNRLLRSTALSWLSWALAFALLPAYLSYGGWGGGAQGAPPTVAITVAAGLLGIGVHVLVALPGLVDDNRAGRRHLPLRLALRVGAPRLLVLTSIWCALCVGLLAVVAGTVGLSR
jgi:hypothetical protein